MVTEAHWRILGHVLYAIRHISWLAMQFALKRAAEYKGRRGRHQTNLLGIIRSDLSRHVHQLELQNAADIKTQRAI